MSKYFYKIWDDAPPTPLPAKLETTSLDARDGFIHLSTARQIPITADLFFGHDTTLWLLKLPVESLDGEIKYVAEAGPDCPHLHNSQHGLGAGNVSDVLAIEKGEHSKWADVPALKQLED